jgi:hypothetical protein
VALNVMVKGRWLVAGGAAMVLVLVVGWLWWGPILPGVHVQSGPAPAPVAPNPAPARPVDLAGWKLVIPEPGRKGDAANISPAVVRPPWLLAQPDGTLRFWAPVCGVSTPNSEHPRTELDSLTNFTAAGSGPHTLTATLMVSQVPSRGDIIIGQIHGAEAISSVPFVMLRYREGELRVVVKKKQSGSSSIKLPVLSALPLRTWFTYAITDNGNGTLTVTANRVGDSKQLTIPIPKPFQGATVRFQAGDYQQGKAGSPACANDGGQVTFSALDRAPDSR